MGAGCKQKSKSYARPFKGVDLCWSGVSGTMGRMAEPEDASVDINEVYRAVGAVMAAATQLEWGLMAAVTSLSRSPLTHVLVEGMRGSNLIQMATRLLNRGIGST